MIDDSGAPPLPRRVPGASGSPRPPVAVERTPIPEDLRQRVLAAIAVEVERDKAEAVLKEDMVRMSLSAAEKVIRARLDDAEHRRLISEAIDDMAKLKA